MREELRANWWRHLLVSIPLAWEVMKSWTLASSTARMFCRISVAYSGEMALRFRSFNVPGALGSPATRFRKMLSGPNSRKKVTMPWRRPEVSEPMIGQV